HCGRDRRPVLDQLAGCVPEHPRPAGGGAASRATGGHTALLQGRAEQAGSPGAGPAGDVGVGPGPAEEDGRAAPVNEQALTVEVEVRIEAAPEDVFPYLVDPALY